MTAQLLRGALHWVQLDKRRPAVIVSPDRRNLLASDVVIVPCSSVVRVMSWHVLLRRGEAGLSADSVAKCEQITTIPKGLIAPKALGTLSSARMREVERALLRALAIFP